VAKLGVWALWGQKSPSGVQGWISGGGFKYIFQKYFVKLKTIVYVHGNTFKCILLSTSSIYLTELEVPVLFVCFVLTRHNTVLSFIFYVLFFYFCVCAFLQRVPIAHNAERCTS